MNTYATLLSSNDYLPGIIGLNYSLKKVNSIFPLLVIATDNLSSSTFEILTKEKINFRVVPTLLYENRTIWENTINKFYIYSMEEYKKICFLDADIIVTKNIDCLFENKTPCFINPADDAFQRKSVFKKGKLINYPFRGGTFLITPNQEEFKILTQDYEAADDEESLFNYYSKKKYYYFPIALKTFLYHSAERPKYWELNENIFHYIDLKIQHKIWVSKFI